MRLKRRRAAFREDAPRTRGATDLGRCPLAPFRAASLCLSLLALGVLACDPQQSSVTSPPNTGVIEVVESSPVRAAGTPVGSFAVEEVGDQQDRARSRAGRARSAGRSTVSGSLPPLRFRVRWRVCCSGSRPRTRPRSRASPFSSRESCGPRPGCLTAGDPSSTGRRAQRGLGCRRLAAVHVSYEKH
jgi:hypothetical protein